MQLSAILKIFFLPKNVFFPKQSSCYRGKSGNTSCIKLVERKLRNAIFENHSRSLKL